MSGVNLSLKTVLYKIWQIATMVNVRVRKDHRIDFRRIISKVQIPDVRLSASTLIQPTVQQEAMSVDFQQMLTSCHCMGCAVKIDPHLRLLPILSGETFFALLCATP